MWGPWEFGESKQGGDHKSYAYVESQYKEDKTQLTPYQIVMYDKARKIVKMDELQEKYKDGVGEGVVGSGCRGLWVVGEPGVGKSWWVR